MSDSIRTTYSEFSLQRAMKKVLSYKNDKDYSDFIKVMGMPEAVAHCCAEIFINEIYTKKGFIVSCAMIKQAYIDLHSTGQFLYL